MSIPKDKNYLSDSVQCGRCDGAGCSLCGDRGWLTPEIHPEGRRCYNDHCLLPLLPSHTAKYCSDECRKRDEDDEEFDP